MLAMRHRDKGRDGQWYHMAQPKHSTHTSKDHIYSVALGRIRYITTAMTTRDQPT